MRRPTPSAQPVTPGREADKPHFFVLPAAVMRRRRIRGIAQRVRYEELAPGDRVVEAACATQAQHVPVAKERDARFRMMRDRDLGRAIGAACRPVALHDNAAGMHPFGMVDAAAVGPAAGDHIAAATRRARPLGTPWPVMLTSGPLP